MGLIDIPKKGSFETINYRLPGRYKFYSTITNACFESLRKSINKDTMKT